MPRRRPSTFVPAMVLAASLLAGAVSTAAAVDGMWSALDAGAPAPSARREYAAILDLVNQRYLIFAGFTNQPDNGYHLFNEVWSLSLGLAPSWTRIEIPGPTPGERHSPQWGYDFARNRLLLFGGYGRHYPGGPYEYLNDIWQLSLNGTPAWTELTPSGTAPSGRLAGSAVYDVLRQRFVGFGGTVGLPVDTWQLDLSDDPAWSTVQTDSVSPNGSYGMTSILDLRRYRMLIFGGSTSDAYHGVHNDVWELVLGPATPTWKKLDPLGTAPSARRTGTSIYDPIRDRMIVFGGWDSGDSIGSFLNDTWTLWLTGIPTWTEMDPSGEIPAGRDAMAAAYDPLGDRMVVFGGWSGASMLGDTQFLTWGAPGEAASMNAVTEADPEVVNVTWNVQNATGAQAGVYRRETGTPWSSIAVAQSSAGQVTFEDHDVTPGSSYGYMIVVPSEQGETFGGDVWVNVPSVRVVPTTFAFALDRVHPNPVVGRFTVSFTLPTAEPARLELLDLAGRRVLSRDVGWFGVGRHHVDLGNARGFRSGIYFLRLTQAGRSATARVVLQGGGSE